MVRKPRPVQFDGVFFDKRNRSAVLIKINEGYIESMQLEEYNEDVPMEYILKRLKGKAEFFGTVVIDTDTFTQ